MLTPAEEELVTELTASATEGALTAAYWNIREHVTLYRNSQEFLEAHRETFAKPQDPQLFQRYIAHEFYARGIEWAARDIATMLGVPESEIKPL